MTFYYKKNILRRLCHVHYVDIMSILCPSPQTLLLAHIICFPYKSSLIHVMHAPHACLSACLAVRAVYCSQFTIASCCCLLGVPDPRRGPPGEAMFDETLYCCAIFAILLYQRTIDVTTRDVYSLLKTIVRVARYVLYHNLTNFAEELRTLK